MPDILTSKEIKDILENRSLNYEEAYSLQQLILDGKLIEDELAEIFQFQKKRRFTEEEILGVVQCSRDYMEKSEIEGNSAIDVCGTGGDKLNTFNISTLNAIVCAAAGVPIVKHGNRAASSKCGGADLLEMLGAKITLSSKQAKECFQECGFVFLFAPLYHPALVHAKKARQTFQERTYFNYIGPLLNPARVKRQLVGISGNDQEMISIMGRALIKAGSERVRLVQSGEGMDEISPSSITQVWDFSGEEDGSVEFQHFKINPKDYGLSLHPIEEIVCLDPEENKQIALEILQGRGLDSRLQAVLLNSAASLQLAGKVKDFAAGLSLAEETVYSGKALKKLEQYVTVSNKLG
jgi:anthranilate phosphoribosyltransferase